MFEFPGDHETEWLSIPEFSSRYDIPKRTLQRYINDGKIRSVRLGSADKYVLHSRSAFEELKQLLPMKYSSAMNPMRDFKGATAAEKNDGHFDAGSLTFAKLETTRLKNEILKMDLEARVGKILPRAVVESIETEYLSQLKAIILQTPSQIARTTGADEAAVQDLIEKALNQFASLLEVKKKRYQDYLQKISSRT